MQATIAQAMSAGAEAIEALLKHKEVKPPRPQRAASSVDLPTSPIPSLGNVLMPATPRVSGSASHSSGPRLKPRRRP